MTKLTDEEFKRLGEENTIDLDQENFDKSENLKTAYRNIIDILKSYCDMKEEYYSLVSLWIVGTYFHKEFVSYPYLFFNAMRGSGKSRILRLISVLSDEGQMLNSLTEAVLFRTTGTLCIDEFEGLSRKGNEALRELLNSAYKKGTKVKRMRKAKSEEGEKQVVEEFDVYRPIVIANIWGMDSVLGDRCINIILEKSSRPEITKKTEIFEHEKITTLTKELFSKGSCSLCNVVYPWNVYQEWNDYITHNYTNYTNYTNNTNYTNYIESENKTFFDKLIELNIDGRHLELAFPLFIIAKDIGEEVLDNTLETFKRIIEEKKEEDLVENKDVSLYEFVSQEPQIDYFMSVNELTHKFKEFLKTDEDWINSKWMGRALKRLGLIIEKRRKTRGIEIILNYQKAQQKIKMFK